MVCVVGCIRDLIWPPPDQLIVIVVSVWDRAAWKSPPGGLLDDALLSFPFSLWARKYVSLYAGIRSWEELLHYEQFMDLLFLGVVKNPDRDDSMQISTLDEACEGCEVRVQPRINSSLRDAHPR